jgi:alkanesulfonate monooxygenase SsuD/methylene tetrahydromethanopterin reductase-like flavin-dependent oxidoreductase (luciferase family)
VELGFHVPIFDIDGGSTAIACELARVGAAAEESGATWLSFMDHYFQIEPTGLPAESHMLEGYTTLGYLAAHTSSVDLGLLVTGVTFRHPGLLAKIVTTLDVLSSGRAVLGIGAAWFDREHRGLGVPFPAVAERFERLEETLRICNQMWDPDDNGPFDGTYYQLAETLCSPQPINRPQSPHRWRRGTQNAAAGRTVWRRMQPVRLVAGGGGAQVGRSPAALRRHRPGLRRDTQDDPSQQSAPHSGNA